MKDAIEKLGGEKLKGLVLDLRDNPGGVVQAALEAASYFLKPGQKILSVKGRSIEEQAVEVPKTANPYMFPLAVLVNGKSASAVGDTDRRLAGSRSRRGDRRAEFRQGAGAKCFSVDWQHGSGADHGVLLHAQRPVHSETAGERAPGDREAGAKSFERIPAVASRAAAEFSPMLLIGPEPSTRLRVVLDASGIITSFATEFIQKHETKADFEVTPALLEEFEVYAGQRNIQPSVGEWSQERGWLQSRLKQEIFNQALGVAKGDEVEAQRDPAVRAAIERLVARL